MWEEELEEDEDGKRLEKQQTNSVIQIKVFVMVTVLVRVLVYHCLGDEHILFQFEII